MDLKNESIEEKVIIAENQNDSINDNYPYASPEFFIKIIPKTLTKEKFDNFYTELYLTKLTAIKNLLEIDPKSSSELQNYLIFLSKVKKQFYIGAGKILLSIKPPDIQENIDYFSLRSWCQNTIGKSMPEWPNHIYTLAHSAYITLINTQKDQAISLLGKIGSGKTFNVLKIIQYLFFISSKQEIRRDQYDLINKAIKLMQIIGNVYNEENVENNSCGFIFHIGFLNSDICIFDIDSEILDITLPFSENGRSFTLLHGFLLTQEKYFKLKHVDFNFFKKYNTIFKEENKEDYEYYQQRDIENFKMFTELCQVFLNENEYIDVLNLFYIILLCNQVTILKNYKFMKGKKQEIYFIGEDGITHRISNILGVDIKDFMSIFFDDMDYSLEKHKNILVAFMKYSYYCIHDFILNKIKEKLKNVFKFYNPNKSNSGENKPKINYIHIIDFSGEKKDQTLGGITSNYANECLQLYSISNYTTMLSSLENNNIRLKKFQAPVSYDIMKSLINYNGILTFLKSDPSKQSVKFEELLTKSDNIPTIIQFIQQKQLINVYYTYLSSCYFFQDLLKESKTLIINKSMIKLFKNCNNIILSKTTLVTSHKHFLISEYVNNKLKYLFCGIENIEPFIVNCVTYDEIIDGNNNYKFNIFNEKRNIIKNVLNWTWYGYEEWISFENFIEEFLQDFTDIKNHYLYHKDINKPKLNFNTSKRDSNASKLSNNEKSNNNTQSGKRSSRSNINEKNNMKEKIEEIISVFNLNNECILGNSFLIMKKGTFNLLKRIEKTLLININSTRDSDIMIDIDKIKNLPIPKKILVQLIKEHQERKESLLKRSEEKKEKEIQKIPNSYITEKNMEELLLPGSKIIHLQILSENLFKQIKNEKNINYYHIDNVLNRKKLEDKNKNNIVIPKNQIDYQTLKNFFEDNKQFNSNLYDIEPIIVFIIYIQKLYRGYIMRKKFTHIYKYVRFYIIILQKYMRGFILRAKYHRFLNCVKKIEFIQIFYKNYFQRKLNAIILIQRIFRKFLYNKMHIIHKNYNYQGGHRKKYSSHKSHSKNKSKKKNNITTSTSNSKRISRQSKIKNISKIPISKIPISKINNEFNKDKYLNKIKSKETSNDITKQFLEETNRKRIINTLLYNKDFMIDADEKFHTDYYRTIYKTKFVYPYLHFNRKNEPKLEDRLIQYGEDKKLKHLLNNFKYHDNENNKCSFKPEINDIYEFEDSFYQRNLKFIQAKKLKLEYNKLKGDELFKYECTFKPKINENKIKRTLDDLFEWQDKINREKEEIKQLYEEFTEQQIQNLKNYRPKNNYYSNMRYLEKMAEKMAKIEENKEKERNCKNKNTDSKSSYLSTNEIVDFGKALDVWPLHLKKNFP